MLRGIANTERLKFSLKGDTENPTIFYIRNIPHEKKLQVWGGLRRPDGTTDEDKAVSKLPDIFIAGVAKIENLNGETIDEINKAVFDRFTMSEQREVCEAISNYNFIGAVETKN